MGRQKSNFFEAADVLLMVLWDLYQTKIKKSGKKNKQNLSFKKTESSFRQCYINFHQDVCETESIKFEIDFNLPNMKMLKDANIYSFAFIPHNQGKMDAMPILDSARG